MRNMKAWLITGAAAMIVISSACADFARAGGILLSVQGAKQGQFKGDAASAKQGNKIQAAAFTFEVTSPRDAASGQATGKRTYKPLQVTKDVGASSPQFLQALTTNEQLPTVTLEFTKADKNGEEYVYYTIKLTNASVASIRQHTAEGAKGGSGAAGANAPQREEIGFTFQRIEVESNDGKTMAVDDWYQGK